MYVITKYDTDFDIKFKDNNWCIKNWWEIISKDIVKNIKKEINENQLRKDIASSNKKIREEIISTALSMPE